MFGFFNIKGYLKAERQVYLIAVLIVFAGFLAGAVYSNMLTEENFSGYTEITQKGIEAARNGQWNKELMPDMWADATNLILIFIWSFFLFGKPFSGFFSFKTGFSAGFFIAFFIKAYGVKGFAAGMYLLFNKLIFVLPAAVLLTSRSFAVNTCITNAVFDKNSPHIKNDIKKMFFPFFAVFITAYAMTSLGNYINFAVMPRILTALF